MENFKETEKKWQQFWAANAEAMAAKDFDKKPKKYILVEFPYPSGSGLHIGHAFTFTGGDVYARFKRMQGNNVLFPMGWDAFGLPTENYAIKTKRKPQEVTKENTTAFEEQMKELAFSFDWSRKVDTTAPNYYRWTQWIFIKLFEKGLAYKQEMPINWCPSCKIGLANEEVMNGKCERCGTEVERRTISQWVVRITSYADRLLEGLEKTDFVEKVKLSQINWIGKSEGARVRFKLSPDSDELEVFTTRPDTLYGATFMVVAPEHELVNNLLDKPEIKDYVVNARKKSDLERTELNKEKTGVFSGLYAVNPMTGKEIPIWISDFVLASYGTGAIMAVPAHDERDFAFAKKFGLPIVPVIQPEKGHDFTRGAYTEVNQGKMINSPEWDGLTPDEAIKKAITFIKEKDFGEGTSSYHLRDWIFSRQHYWGEPIPMIYCDTHKWVPVPVDQLPITLPEVEHYEPTDNGESPLANISNWVETICPICGRPAKRETDTMPNWAGSDWYYLGYLCNLGKSNEQIPITKQITNSKSPVPNEDIFTKNKEKIKYWMPVDVYVGGDEHNTLHLLYSRFIYKFLYDLGVLPTANDEPYQKRISHGVILGPDNQRMSKSRGNVIVPGTVTAQYGVDVTRMYLMFMGPFDSTMAWNEKTLMGIKRFLDRFENYFSHVTISTASSQNILVLANKAIKGITEDLESFKYNTAIAKLMELLNGLNEQPEKQIGRTEAKAIVKLAAPFAPYLTEELWSRIKEGGDELSVHLAAWPKWEERYVKNKVMTIAVAENGKVRDELQIEDRALSKEEIISRAKASDKMKKRLEGKTVVKEIYVPGKMVNLVVKSEERYN